MAAGGQGDVSGGNAAEAVAVFLGPGAVGVGAGPGAGCGGGLGVGSGGLVGGADGVHEVVDAGQGFAPGAGAGAVAGPDEDVVGAAAGEASSGLSAVGPGQGGDAVGGGEDGVADALGVAEGGCGDGGEADAAGFQQAVGVAQEGFDHGLPCGGGVGVGVFAVSAGAVGRVGHDGVDGGVGQGRQDGLVVGEVECVAGHACIEGGSDGCLTMWDRRGGRPSRRAGMSRAGRPAGPVAV